MNGEDGMSDDDVRLRRLAHAVLQPGFAGTRAPDWLLRRLADGLGSVLLFARNVDAAEPGQMAGLTAGLRSANPDVIVAIDEEGGDVTRLEAATGSSYPGNLALGAVDDVRLTERVARSLGGRLARVGIDLDYAPVVDVNSNPNNPIIGVRSFGGDPALVARHAAAWVRGLQSAGVGACAKHFPGHGDTDVDSHLELPTVRMTLPDLREVALPSFRAAIYAGVRAVMVGHLLLPAIDPTAPASVSRRVTTSLLREQLGFSGLIVTDAMEMRAVADRYGLERAAVLAIAAGADLVCIGHTANDELVGRLQATLVNAVDDGELAEERLVEAAARVAEFAAWKSPDEDELGGAAEDGIGLTAARRALRIDVHDACVLPLKAAPHVVAFTTAGPAALGSIVETSLGTQLAEMLAGTTRTVLGECGENAVERVLADAAGRPLVLAVRSAHRHPWMLAALDRLLARRPDAIVAEMGLPGAEPPRGAVHVVAHGAGRACATAVAEALIQGADS